MAALSSEKAALEPQPDVAREFLAYLDDIHLVSILPDGKPKANPKDGTIGRHFGTNVDQAIEWAASQNAAGRGIYWTVNGVKSGINKKPTKAEITHARMAHVDIDPKQDGTPFDANAQVSALQDLEFPPSFILHSGGGVQAFWRLNEPCENWGQVECINRGLRDWFDADNCFNIDRLMRVPGFINWPNEKKRNAGRQPAVAYILQQDSGDEFEPHNLAAVFPERIDEDNKKPETDGATGAEYTAELGNSLRKMLQTMPERHKGDRSAWALGVARIMATKGYSHDHIKRALLDPSNAISAHFYAQNDPEYAIGRILNKLSATAPKPNGVELSDFHAYMPAHNYIYAPTGEPWPASSVNSRIPPVALFDHKGNPVCDDKGEHIEQAANTWLDKNQPVEQVTWAPGYPQVITNRLVADGGWIERPGCNVFNYYRPPLPGGGDASDVAPWLDHVNHVYPDDADHIIKWLAHRVQRPHEKINHAIVLGGQQGVGKDTILQPVKEAIGHWNFAEVSPQHMLGRFNGFVKSVILRVSEARDLGDVDRFAFYDHMKTYTAAPPDVLRVDEKHQREYSVFNIMGVIITTNHKLDGLYLPADDRRHYVAWSNLNRETFDDDYWGKIWGWYRDGGIANVGAFLCELDISDFDAKAPPIKTAAFWDIVGANHAPEDSELADALDRLGWPGAVTIGRIATAADPAFAEFLRDRTNSRRIPHRLETAGYVSVRNAGQKDGRWKVDGNNVAIYAKLEMTERERQIAASTLAGWRHAA